jgi:TetR/AcrR family transcriptional regulator, multidrug resistance operon repressor
MRIKDEDKISRIYNAAIRIINRDGFEGCSMSKIAKEADIAPATIYLYFDNKEDMMKKLFIHVKQGMGKSYFQGENELTVCKETFRNIWYNHYEYIISNFDEYIFLENFSNSPQLMHIEREYKLDYCPVFESLLNRSKEEKLLINISNDLIYSMLFAPLSYLLKKTKSELKSLTESDIQQVFEISWKGISF